MYFFENFKSVAYHVFETQNRLRTLIFKKMKIFYKAIAMEMFFHLSLKKHASAKIVKFASLRFQRISYLNICLCIYLKVSKSEYSNYGCTLSHSWDNRNQTIQINLWYGLLQSNRQWKNLSKCILKTYL